MRPNGINKVAIIIGVVIGLVIVGIGGFLMLSDNEPKTPPVENKPPVVEDTEITAEEQSKIREFLSKIAYVAIASENSTALTSTITEEHAMIYMATMGIEKEDLEESTNTGAQNSGINMDLTVPQNNTVQDTNILNNIQNTVDNTIGNAVGNTVQNTIINENTVMQNRLGISEDTIQDALFEMFGQQLDNLPTILQGITEQQDLVLPQITELEEVSKSNGIYTAVYSACPMTLADQTNGTNIYGLDSYSIQVKFEKNEAPEYSDYKMSSMTVLSKTTPIAYHISYVADVAKYGVIDNNGTVIINAQYSKVVIPNSYVGLFFCYTDDQTPPVILNERGIEQFKDYQSVEQIQGTAGSEGTWNEVNILKVLQEGYYGAVDYKGNVIYEPEYEEIVPLGYEREKLVLTQDGLQALADIHGNILSDFAYAKIGILGIDFDSTVLVSQTVTQDQILTMMQQNDYIVGQTSAGTYEILETKPATQETPIMSTLAKEYTMTIGTAWQLAILDEVIPVYVKQSQM